MADQFSLRCYSYLLVFNEGYSRPADRTDLAAEAARAVRLLAGLMPDEAEVHGLRALILLQHSRRAARIAADGSLVLLEDQDRSAWDGDAIREGIEALELAERLRRPGPYQLQAAIAACHAIAPSFEATDWTTIARVYALIEQMSPSPVVALNRAVAISFADGPQAALSLLADLADRLDGYHPFHAAQGDVLRRLGRRADALVAYRRAVRLAPTSAERAFLKRRIGEIGA